MRILPAIALLALLPLAACQRPAPADAQDPAASSSQAGPDDGLITRTTRAALEKAKAEMAKGNIPVGGRESGNVMVNGVKIGGHGNRTAHLPRAEITPAGELLIDGKPVPADEAQRQALLEHRAAILSIAQAGVDIGIQGASLGAKAATGAIASVFSGNTAEFEKKMEAEARQIELHALKLCEHLPRMLATQQALAAALPEFQPYAVMQEGDIKDCLDDLRQAQDQAQD
jgi:hypothetical protein